MSDPDDHPGGYDGWLEDQAQREALEEAMEELDHQIAVGLTEADVNRIAASLALTGAVQLVVGDEARARRSMRLARRLRAQVSEES